MRVVNAWEPRTANSGQTVGYFIPHRDKRSRPALPSSGGRGTFSVAACNIRCSRYAGLASAAKGLAQMGVDVAVLMEMKITDD